jgi:hypothetical protein
VRIGLFHLKALVASLLTLAAVSTPLVTAGAQAHPVKHSAKHVRKHHPPRRHSKIPQRNGGDQDSDNNGGPSDGDGNV